MNTTPFMPSDGMSKAHKLVLKQREDGKSTKQDDTQICGGCELVAIATTIASARASTAALRTSRDPLRRSMEEHLRIPLKRAM